MHIKGFQDSSYLIGQVEAIKANNDEQMKHQ